MSGRGGQTSFQLASDRDYRRGVILGLTLAEVMLLLVFLLLLAAGTIITRAQEEAARQSARVAGLTSTLGPVMDALSRNGVRVEDIDQLSALLRRGQDSDALRKGVDEMRSALTQSQRDSASAHELLAKTQAEIAAIRSELAAADANRSRLAELTAKAEALDRIAKTLDGLPGSAGARPEQELANMVGQWREALVRLKRLPGGGKPVCWARANGEPESMFIVELRDDGYRVRDPTPRPRPDDSVWAVAERLPRDTLIDPRDINSVMSGVIAEANRRQCRFAVTVRDSTGISNKTQYKKLNYPLYQAFEVKETSQ